MTFRVEVSYHAAYDDSKIKDKVEDLPTAEAAQAAADRIAGDLREGAATLRRKGYKGTLTAKLKIIDDSTRKPVRRQNFRF